MKSDDTDVADLHRQIALLQAELDRYAPTEAELVGAERRIEALQSLIEEQSQRLTEEQRRTADLMAEIAAVRGSLSWRITAPLRAVRRLFRAR